MEILSEDESAASIQLTYDELAIVYCALVEAAAGTFTLPPKSSAHVWAEPLMTLIAYAHNSSRLLPR